MLYVAKKHLDRILQLWPTVLVDSLLLIDA